jgi:phosphoglycerol transferase MdoB-like AlkP superfamily enzyme
MHLPSLSKDRFRPLWIIAALYLTMSTLLRLVLWATFDQPTGSSLLELAASLPLGALNDLATLVYLLFPATLLLALLPQRLLASRFMKYPATVGLAALLFGMLYLACVEFFFFREFDARFNLVAVDYLVYNHEVFINIWESYHVIWFLLGCAGLSLLLSIVLRRRLIRDGFPPVMPMRRRLSFIAGHLVLMLLVLALVSTDSLALFGNRITNEIVANGVSSLFRAFHTNELDYTEYYPTLPEDQAFRMIRSELGQRGGRLAQNDPEELLRDFPARPGLGTLNVVVIVEESFGAQFNGAYGAKPDLTPNFDRLAQEGLLFTNAYASGTRTVRGLGAIVTSLPPIPSEGIIKRPGSWPIANWGEVMRRQGYLPSFLYGGYGLFDNMNPFFAGNGFAISDRKDIDRVTFSNIWGVCDQDLFNHALDYYDRESAGGHPFFSVMMTTSNHSPYTFPAGIPGVQAKGGDRTAGVRYADYALGEFMDKARAHRWYGDTLFVIVADHDARVYGREQIPLRHYRIPLLILAPGRLQPRKVTAAVGQIDIAPTVLGLLGLPYQAPFYGQDVLQAPAGQARPLLINHDHDVGLLLGDRLAVLGLHRRQGFYRVAADGSLLPADNDPQLAALATAYFQTAFDLFKNHRYQLPPESFAEEPRPQT